MVRPFYLTSFIRPPIYLFCWFLFAIPVFAGVSGVVTDSLTSTPITGAFVKFGATDSTFTTSTGSYNLPNVGSGTFEVEVRKRGYLNLHSSMVLQVGNNTVNITLAPLTAPYNPIGNWTFDNSSNLVRASTGNPFFLQGIHTSISGPTPENGAVNIGVGSFYRCYHDIAANGGSTTWVNEYSIVIDFRVSQLGRWYTFFQTNYPNTNDGDCFINTNGNIGVAATGYSSYTVLANEWYRLIISVDLGSSYTYYLDGQLLLQGTNQSVDGRFALYPSTNGNQVLFFADENGEDNPIDIAQVMLYDRPLTNQEATQLGGYGHFIQNPVNVMTPYLQTATPTSMTIGWHCQVSTNTVVEYGTTSALGLTQTGTATQLGTQQLWHQVNLINLQPDTRYYYRCRTDTAVTSIATFRTPPNHGARSGKLRFLLISDSQSNSAVSTRVSTAIEQTLVSRFGTNFADSVNLVMHNGDIVGNGLNLASYQTEYFLPFSNLTKRVPFMVSIGNHESESPYFYNYMHYTPFGGDGGELYYSFQLARVLFISLNSNIQGNTQLQWLSNRLTQAQSDTTIDMVFVSTHKPGHSEVWPDGNTAWVYNSVMPILDSYSKVALISFGHSHNYERGVRPTGNYRTLICGGAGGTLDRWRMFGNQTDYPEIHRSMDYLHYVLVEVSLLDGSYKAEAYSLGNSNVVMNNTMFDQWQHRLYAPIGTTPTAILPSNETYGTVSLVASNFMGTDTIFSSQFQLTTTPSNYSTPLLDVTRHFENFYLDTGAPEYQPTNLNSGIELNQLNGIESSLLAGLTYGWRVRYRDSNLRWTGWSNEQVFTWHGLGVNEPKPEIPQNWLSQNYPNPFNSSTLITFSLSKSSWVRIVLLNELGQFVREIEAQTYTEGMHQFRFDGAGLPSGFYFVTFESNLLRDVLKIHLVR